MCTLLNKFSQCFTEKGKSIHVHVLSHWTEKRQTHTHTHTHAHTRTHTHRAEKKKKRRTEKESAFERGHLCSCGRTCQAVFVQRKHAVLMVHLISVSEQQSLHTHCSTRKKTTDFLRTLPFFCLIHITQRPTWAATGAQVSVARQQQH